MDPDTTDEELLTLIARGDAGAFGHFYDRHATTLFSIIVRILHDESEAEDVLQESCVALWERAASYRSALGRPLSWAVTIARNRAIDRLRATQRHRITLEEAGAMADFTDRQAPDAAGQAAGAEAATEIRGLLHQLPAAQRLAIELAFFRGLSQTEIADHLAEPLGTVKARIRRGMLQLRDGLEGHL